MKWFSVFLEELSESIMVIIVSEEAGEANILETWNGLLPSEVQVGHFPCAMKTEYKIKSLLNIYIKAWLINQMFSSISGVSSKCHQFWFFFSMRYKDKLRNCGQGAVAGSTLRALRPSKQISEGQVREGFLIPQESIHHCGVPLSGRKCPSVARGQ